MINLDKIKKITEINKKRLRKKSKKITIRKIKKIYKLIKKESELGSDCCYIEWKDYDIYGERNIYTKFFKLKGFEVDLDCTYLTILW